MHVGARLGCAWVFTLSIVCAPAPSAGSPSLVGGGGIDYSQGSGGESTRGVLAIVGSSVGSGNATLALVRYRDSATGDGLGWIGAVRAPLARGHGLAASGARFVGDDSLRSWRVKVGPVLELPSGGTAGVYYTHAQDDAGARADAAAAELSLPLSARFTGRASGAYGSAPGGLRTALASVGLGWAPAHGLELTGDLGVSRNGAFATTPGSPSNPLTRLLGRGGSRGGTTRETRVDPLLQLGVRVLLP